jgi:type I restriction enzyme, R subunit
MFVCVVKITCVRMYGLITRYREERMAALKAGLGKIGDEQEEITRRRQIEWMRETRMAVVVSEEQGEADKFRKWGLDITPHRRLIKEGMDLTEAICAKPQFHNLQRMSLDDAFKEPEHPFRIAVVCAMWLTGFDVPTLSTLYLDKPLKAHTLMQAIARANRLAEGKNNGLIVDYCGILRHLRKALATFAGTADAGPGEDGELKPARPEEELLADVAEAIVFVRAFLTERGASLDDLIKRTGFARNAAILAAKEAANESDETRKRFEIMCREVFKKFKACIRPRMMRLMSAWYPLRTDSSSTTKPSSPNTTVKKIGRPSSRPSRPCCAWSTSWVKKSTGRCARVWTKNRSPSSTCSRSPLSRPRRSNASSRWPSSCWKN